MIKYYLTLYLWDIYGIILVIYVRMDVHCLAESLKAAHAFLEKLDEGGESLYRRKEYVYIKKKSDYVSILGIPLSDQVASVCEHQKADYVRYEFDSGEVLCHYLVGLFLCFLEILISSGEFLDFVVFVCESLDHADSRYRIVNLSIYVGDFLAHLPEGTLHLNVL